MTSDRVSLSSWALHPLIGTCAPERPGAPNDRLMESKEGALSMLNLAEVAADHDFTRLEIPHFQLPSTDRSYLEELRASFAAFDVELWSLLIDDGDINHPEFAVRDREWVESWIEHAAVLGAKSVRVIGGKQPNGEDEIERTVRQLDRIADFADRFHIRVRTENWFPTLSDAATVRRVLTECDSRIGLCFDFGNWHGEGKYDELAKIAEFADSCHAKFETVDDFERCARILLGAKYEGPFTLVHAELHRVWESLNDQRERLIALD